MTTGEAGAIPETNPVSKHTQRKRLVRVKFGQSEKFLRHGHAFTCQILRHKKVIAAGLKAVPLLYQEEQ